MSVWVLKKFVDLAKGRKDTDVHRGEISTSPRDSGIPNLVQS